MHIIEWCRAKKTELGTQKAVAVYLDMSETQLSLLLNGVRTPSLPMQQDIQRKTGGAVCRVDDFVM